MTGIRAIVLAGSRPGVDPFAAQFGTDLKALIPVAGEPMVRRPVEALLASEGVGNVLVLAQQPERIGAVLPADPRLAVERSLKTIASTLLALADSPATQWPVLVTTADHALLTPAIIEEFIGKAEGSDVAIGVVGKDVLMQRLPESDRTWVPFRGGAYTGANLFLLGSAKVRPAIELWRSVEQDRKKGARLLLGFGPSVLLGAVLRIRTLDQTLASLGRKLGLSIRAVKLSEALAAVDVDKPADLRLAEAILTERGDV
ncbi:MAG TPA: nucleotidyltransferase family protein [Sphingomicrobium sp.]|nr:nucleotidyltransferase family protein [Sphingomicrobium sp.]